MIIFGESCFEKQTIYSAATGPSDVAPATQRDGIKEQKHASITAVDEFIISKASAFVCK